jgi:sugar phosphate isomerase/epimerase
MKAGIDNLRRLDLSTEASSLSGPEEIRPFSDFAISAHAPMSKDEMRLNIAATDEDFRQISINELLGYVDMVRQFPKIRQINMHPAPKQWLNKTQASGRRGDYSLMVEGIRRIAAYAGQWGLEIVLENNNAYFDDTPDDVSADQIDWSEMNQSFGSSPEEWIRICEDVDRPNVALCLDSSHVCTYAQTVADPQRRKDITMAFLAKPHLIRHVHWNDNYLYDPRGRKDSHALIGKGSLPVELHRAIKGLDATILIEHFYTTEELEEELDYIARL